MKTLLVMFTLFCLSPSYAMGPSRPCGQEQQQQDQGKGKGKGGQGQQQQQQCQQQQQQQEQQGKGGGVCAPLAAACLDAGYTGSSVDRCVDGILKDQESEISVYVGDKIACNNARKASW